MNEYNELIEELKLFKDLISYEYYKDILTDEEFKDLRKQLKECFRTCKERVMLQNIVLKLELKKKGININE